MVTASHSAARNVRKLDDAQTAEFSSVEFVESAVLSLLADGAHAGGTRMRSGTARRAEAVLQILSMAAEAFTERGYAATSIDDVADRLRVTKGFVYHYYRAKGDLFLDVHRVALHMMLRAAEPIAHSDLEPPEKLAEMARAHAKLMVVQRSFMRVAVQSVEMHLVQGTRMLQNAGDDVWEMRDRYESLFVRVIEQGVRRKVFRRLQPQLASKAVLGSLNWISVWIHPTSPQKVDQIADEFATFAVAGVKV